MKLRGNNDEIKCVLFDLDGLLVNSEKLYWDANIQAAREENLPIPEDSYLKNIGASVKAIGEFYHKYFATTEAKDKYIERTDEIVDQWTDQGKLKLRPGVQRALDYFQGQNLKMAIVSSNYDQVVQKFAWKTGIRNYFDFHLSYQDVLDDHLKAKPAPDIYLKAVKESGMAKENILVFEDSSTGVAAAKNAGLKVVMIPFLLPANAEDKKNATLICQDFNQFLDEI